MSFSIRSDVVQLDPSLVLLWMSEINMDQLFQIATTTALVYDSLITMDKEVKYFWGTKIKIINIVFFLNRYVGILGAISYLFWDSYGADIRLFADWTHNFANWASVIAIDYILMLRVLALYSYARGLAWFLGTMLAMEAIFKLGVLIYGTLFEGVVAIGLGPDGPTTCGAWASISLLIPLGIADWIFPMVYGIILMALALFKAAEFWKMSAGFKGFNLIKVLIEDQAFYFIFAVLCCIFNIIEFKLEIPNDFLANVLQALGRPSFLCILGSRMIFNLKDAGERGLNEGTTYRTRTVSEMEFV